MLTIYKDSFSLHAYIVKGIINDHCEEYIIPI